MPEGPELHLASRFVNSIGREHVFTGKVEKSAVSTKNPDVDWNENSYIISAQSRGKEVKLTLTEWQADEKLKTTKTKPKSLNILFRFGMSGKFTFTKLDEKAKHAHLIFHTAKDDMILSFVDYRRFGRWEVNGDWSKGRGPCVIQEYQEFRNHVLKNLNSSVFGKPICEVMLNQAYFSGIGNYLRAEILYRLKIPPFVSARSVLENLVKDSEDSDKKSKVKSETPDILQLCNIVSTEVINLDGIGYDPDTGTGNLSDFNTWLQCYYNPNMKNMVDHNGRTIWFCGEAGPLKPKDSKTRGMKRNKKNDKAVKEESGIDEPQVAEIKKEKKERRKETPATVKTRKKVLKLNTPSAVTPVKNSRLTRGKLTKVVQNGNSPHLTNKRLKQPKTAIVKAVKQANSPDVHQTPKALAKRLTTQNGPTPMGSPSSGRGLRRSARNKP